MNSPSQKDSGIDDSSPLSYDDPGEHAQLPDYQSKVSNQKHFVVDSSTNRKTFSEIVYENHNQSESTKDCETCVDKCESKQFVYQNKGESKELDVIQQEDNSIIVIDDDNEKLKDDEVDILKVSVDDHQMEWNADSSHSYQSGQRHKDDESPEPGKLSKEFAEEEVIISSTTSPEREDLLKEAGLLTHSLLSKGPKDRGSRSNKVVRSKAESIFDIFNLDNVDSTGDVNQVKHAADSTNSCDMQTVSEDLCDSTQNTETVSVSDRPALFSIFDPDSNSLGSLGIGTPAKECPENKSHPDVLRRNIFEVLAQESSLHSAEQENLVESPTKSKAYSFIQEKEEKSKPTASSSHFKGTDFESATGESQFNFYNSSNKIAEDTGIDSSGIIYNDCYMAEEGEFQSLQNTCSSSLQSEDNECYSQGGHTPSKYAFLSQDSANMKDVLSLNDVSVVESPNREKQTDFKYQSAKFIDRDASIETPRTHQFSDSGSVLVTDTMGSQKRSPSQAMSSRQIKCFQNSQHRIVLLRRRICKFLRLAFPFLQYPTYFKTHAVCVENLLDQIICIIDRSKGSCHTQHAIPTELTCCEVRVVVCKSPRQCLNFLRRKIIRFLQAVLPDMKVSPSFDTSSEMVESLLQQIIICNQKHEKSS